MGNSKTNVSLKTMTHFAESLSWSPALTYPSASSRLKKLPRSGVVGGQEHTVSGVSGETFL